MTIREDAAADRLLELFPEGTVLDSHGELMIGGCRTSDLAASFGTPAYIVDETALRATIRRFADGLLARWANSQVVWASKSAPSTAMYRLMADEGLAIDVAGGGELFMALAAGVDPGRIVVHGNAKTDDDIARAVSAGVGLVVVDNFDDLDRLERLATSEQAVLVRVIPEIDADTHSANATGHAGSKFGLGMADAATAMARIAASDVLRLDGVHAHVGSQIMDTEPLARVVDALGRLGDHATYNLGGGLGVRYTSADSVPSVDEYLDAVTSRAAAVLPPSAKLMIEPGRSLVARAGVTLYRVVTVKRGVRTFVAVDGGMADNLEVSLYGQRFEATVADRVGGGSSCALVGRHCESGDELIADVALRDIRVGDLIAMPVTGAYCSTMANNYNGARRPPLVFAACGVPRVVVRRETYDDFLRRDVV